MEGIIALWTGSHILLLEADNHECPRPMRLRFCRQTRLYPPKALMGLVSSKDRAHFLSLWRFHSGKHEKVTFSAVRLQPFSRYRALEDLKFVTHISVACS